MKIDPIQLNSWKKDEVTVALFKLLEEVKQYRHEEFLNPTVLCDSKIAERCAHWAGWLEAVDAIVNLDVDTLNREEDNDEI